jgi:hypothetical protein
MKYTNEQTESYSKGYHAGRQAQRDDSKYNGWTNRNTWLVALWIDNEQGSQEYVIEQARELLESNDFDRDSATSDLATWLQDYHDKIQEEQTGFTGVLANLLNTALAFVEWHEIAKHYIDDIEVFSAGWNMPGYMPDNEPAQFLESSEAMEYLQESVAESGEHESQCDIALDWKADKNGEFGQTLGQFHYFIAKV